MTSEVVGTENKKKQKQKDRMYFEIFLGFRIQFQYWGILYYFY